MTVDLSYTDEERAYWHGRHNARPLDLGHGVRAQFYELHRGPAGIKAGITISHIHDDDLVCEGSVMFDLPETREGFPDSPRWRLHSLDPLTLAPSILQRPCGLHGFIREGRWVPA